MSRRVNQITIEGKQIRQAVNVGPRGPQGPQGPQGRGLEINTVVDTPADLPPTAPPGHTVLILSSNTVSVWASGAWWDLGGPVQGEPPDLGQLRADNPVPGGNILPDDIIHLARALTEGNPAGGVNSYGGTFEELAAFVFGNISVITGSGGRVSIRIPGDAGGLQIEFMTNLVLERTNQNWMESADTAANEFLRPFSYSVLTHFTLPARSADYQNGMVPNMQGFPKSNPSSTHYKAILQRGGVADPYPENGRITGISAFAIGRY